MKNFKEIALSEQELKEYYSGKIESIVFKNLKRRKLGCNASKDEIQDAIVDMMENGLRSLPLLDIEDLVNDYLGSGC